jgi:YVTN family beta-propeller protein
MAILAGDMFEPGGGEIKYRIKIKKMKKSIFVTAGIFLSLLGLNGQNVPDGYKIVQRIHLEGDGFWDYLNADDATGMLYVSHGKMVHVVDMNSGKNVATITDVNGVHGIAIAAEFSKGFISNGPDSNVTVFSLKDYHVIEKVPVTGRNPDAILYEPFTKTIITWNGRSSNATVIDAKTDKVIQTIPLAGKPEAAVSDGNGKVFVNIEDKSEVCMINVKSWKVEQTWSIAPGEEPSGLAIDNETHRLFSATDKLMVVLDAETGKVVTTLVTGGRVDGAGFDPGLKRAYSSCGEGVLTVVQEENKSSFIVLANIPTQAGARTISVSSKTHRIYLPTAEFGPAPEKTTDNPRPRPTLKPGTFTVLVIEPVK